MTGGEREVVQAGVELTGASGPIADADVLALLVESLERCGLRLDGATIQVGHVGIVQRLFAPLAEGPRSAVLSALRAGDLVGALRRAHEAGMPSEDVTRARAALGVIGRGIEQLDGDDVRELRQVVHLARERWPGSVKLWGLPNIGLVPALPYYTAIVFEALHPDVGVIASGGRYDLLIGAYGAPRPATGFAIDVLRLHRALFAEGWRPADARTLVTLHSGGDERATMRCAASLRAAGLSVAIGDVAETAGIALIAAEVVDERRVKLGDGRTLDAADLALERSLDEYRHLGSLEVATKYPRVAEAHFRARGLEVEIVKVAGSAEVAPQVGLADWIVDLVATGGTLRANDLAIVEEIAACSARLIANPASYHYRRAEIAPLAEKLADWASRSRSSE